MSEKQYHKQLDNYVLGMLTPAERAEFELHLESCQSCREELQELQQLQSRIAKLPKGISPNRDLWQAIDSELPRTPAGTSLPEPDRSHDIPSILRSANSDRKSWITLYPARFYFRAAAVVLILLGGVALWLALKNSGTDLKVLQLSPENPGGPEIAASKQESSAVQQERPAPALTEAHIPESRNVSAPEQRGVKTAPPITAGESLADQSAAGISPGIPFLQHIQSSFASYSGRLPNDRVYLQFDRPFYNRGETIWFRAYVRNEQDLHPSGQSDILHVEFINPKGGIERRFTLLAKDGVASGDIDLDQTLPGGLYKVKAYTQWQRNFEDAFLFEKEIQVQEVVLPHLKMKLEFERKAFGPGDNVIAKFEASTLENSPLSNVEFNFVVNISGQQFTENSGRTDYAGTAYASFDLPKDLSSMDGILGIVIQYQGEVESISKSIPIVLNKIRFTMYPEGGDLVNGLPGNVAFQALNEFDKPADVAGVVLDDLGREVTAFSSYHQGMGAFAITPEAGRRYHARVTRPEGIAETFDLPQTLAAGYTFAAEHASSGRPTFIIGSQNDEQMSIIAQMRGKIYFTRHFTARAGLTTIPFATDGLPAGVVQATLFDDNGVEQAERLMFVNKNKILKVQVSMDKERYLPREKVTLSIRATDPKGNPAPGNLSLAVADDKLISFADDKSGHILSQLLLEPDLRGKVEEPDFYFDPREPKADQALDYLMMTHGWRRFTWKQVLADKLADIKFMPERANIAGIVYDATSGRPLGGVRVQLSGIDSLTISTDSAGRYAFRSIDLSSSATIEITKKGFDPYFNTVTNYADNLDYHLWKKGSQTEVVGRIFDSRTKAPLAGADVSIVGTNSHATTNDQGLFTIAGIRSGTYTVEVQESGYMKVQNRNVNINAPQAVVDIGLEFSGEVTQAGKPLIDRAGGNQKDRTNRTMKNSGTIVGKISDEKNGDPLANVTVLIVNTTIGAVTDLDGRYRIIGVPMGTYALRASQVGYQALQISGVIVGQGETTTLNFKLLPATVELQALSITAERPMVNSLTTSSATTVNAKSIEHIPSVKSAEDVLKLQLGTVKAEQNLFLRGGKGKDVQYPADGIPANRPMGAAAPGDKRLRRGGAKFNTGLAGRQARQRQFAELPPAPPENELIRFYRAREFPAPVYASEQAPAVRTDFRSTIFWKGDVVLDRAGKATVSFYNSDELTSFRATVEGISESGMAGRAEKTYYTQLPFSLSAKIPVEVSFGDQVSVPLTLKNNTGRTISGTIAVKSPESWRSSGDVGKLQSLAAGTTRTIYVPFEVIDKPGPGSVELSFESEGLRDAFQQGVLVKEKGFPQLLSFSSSEREKTYAVRLNSPIKGTLQAKVSAYPTVGSNLLTAIDAILREPNGCFEQTSSSNYPNVIALRYLKETGVKDPSLMSRAARLLEDGYKRLTTFETKDKGYEWFGSTPPNEALTAYGLMEFKDMEPVYAGLDKSMVDRTAKWLIGRRDGMGGFFRDPKALDSFGGASREITNAYIVYSLAEAGFTDIKPELAVAYQSAMGSRDPYELALLANALLSLGEKDRCAKVLSDLVNAQGEDGSWDGKTHSITHSTGISLKIETSALSLLALIRSGNPDHEVVNKGVKFLLSSRTGYGGFGSTQSTILALKALTEYAKYSQHTAESGVLDVILDGKKIASKPYEAGERGPIVIDGLEKYIAANEQHHSMTIAMAGMKHPLPHSVLFSWNTTLPNSSDSVKVVLETKLAQHTVRMGETVRLSAELQNITPDGLPMTIAVIGIPGGLSAQPWQLKELKEKKVFDFYEINGRYIAFYYRQMAPGEKRIINLDLKADIPGLYEAPASSAYLYYTNEYKSWNSAGTIEVTMP